METKDLIGQLSDQVKQFNDDNKGLVKEAKEARAAMEEIRKEYTDKVKELNTALAAKDATIKQIQDEVKEMKAKGGQMGGGTQGFTDSVDQLIAKSFESPEATEVLKSGRLNDAWYTDKLPKNPKWKAAGTIIVGTGGNNVTGATIVGVPTWSNEIWGAERADVHFRDLFRVIDSATGTFTYYRENTPAGEGSVQTVLPAGQKPLIDKDLSLQTATAYYKAGVADIAKESLQDIPMLQSYLNQVLVDDYLDVETYDMFTALLAAASGTNTIPVGATKTVEKLIHLIKNQRKSKNRFDRLIVKPDIWAETILTKPNDYSTPNVVTVLPNGQVAILGVPMSVTNTDAIADRQVLVGDSRKAAIMQVIGEGLKLELFKQHDKAVYQNLVSLRVEARVAPIIFRTEAFIKATLGAES